ncbi:hypothetical protein ECANGB1_1174 [Enterospora canceri]|uniref:L-type lectin-like domain-containing protein n=1 Tax=Enterospora canceri TaxID=1081671 RepID=A0A1Y1S6N3_9MICR|nr:hypothetical protein ECANGB1_1174 [Enterospora canceri]
MNIFPNILLLTNGVDCKAAGAYRAMNRITLIEPFVNENGKNDTFVYDGDYVVSCKGYSNFIQLGYYTSQSNGIVQTREPFKKKNFKFEIYFTLDSVQKGGNGFGFWVSSKLTSGGFYGRNKDYKGYGVCVSTKGTPYVQFMNSNNQRSKKITLKDPTGSHVIIFENQHPNLRVLYKSSKSNKKELLWAGSTNVEPTFVLGASAHTGGSQTVLRVFSLFGSAMRGIEETFVPSEQQKSSPVVMILGIISICVLIYYLYTKQNKPRELTN